MRTILTLTIFALLLTGLASSTSVGSEEITVDLQDNTIDAELYFDDLTSNSFTYITNHPVENYNVEINSEPVACEFEQMAIGGEIKCPTDFQENFTVDLRYETRGLTTAQNGIRTFRYSQSIYRPVDNYTFKVILPEGTGLLDQSNISTPVVEPQDGEVGSEGRRIHVEWAENPTIGSTQSFQVTYESLDTDYQQILLIGIGGLLLIAILTRFYLSRKSVEEDTETIESLTEDEKQVFELIEAEDGSMLQKDIVDQSEYSKAKISGVVSGLEEKGIVSKEKEGRSNRVKLS